MSNAFNNFLSLANSSYREGTPILKDYQHASRLFIDNYYSKAPKVGFLYFIAFNVNQDAIKDPRWANATSELGLLVKKIDLPKFTIATETLNQYNRKTLVHTKLNYDSISIEFHDDNSDLINNFWINYYRYYFKDSNYGGSQQGSPKRDEKNPAFDDTKFLDINYEYGRYQSTGIPFLSSIDIYVLSQQNFTQMTLVNPKVTSWQHDNVSASEAGKILQNKMTVSYENVYYNNGTIKRNPIEGFQIFYDKSPSPYGVAGVPVNQSNNRNQSEFDKPGKERVFGRTGGQYGQKNPVLNIAEILAKNYLNKKGLGRAGSVGYNIASGVLGALGNAGAGKYSEPPPSVNQPGIINLPGGVGINIFKGLNTSVDGKIRANPAAIIFPKIKGGGG